MMDQNKYFLFTNFHQASGWISDLFKSLFLSQVKLYHDLVSFISDGDENPQDLICCADIF